MFGNYLKIAFRSIFRNKVFSLINIAGLSVGIACFILILLWIRDEMSFDSFHTNLKQIYQIQKEYQLGTEINANPSTPFPLARSAVEQVPEIISATHFYRGRTTVRYGKNVYNENMVCYTDSSIFSILTFEFIRGASEIALKNPNSVIISRKMVSKYFGGEDPVGKIMKFNDRYDLMVAGVIKDVPSNSAFRFDFFAPIDLITRDDDEENWGSHWLFTFVFLERGAVIQRVEQKISTLIQERLPAERIALKLQALKDLHLYSVEGNRTGMRYVIFFSLIASFILLIACINYMNLSTARSAKRIREIGIRKLIGAMRRQLISQIIIESFIYSVISLLFALIIVELCRPAFNNLTGKTLSIHYIEPGFMGIILGVLIVTGFLAGSYPALILSRFRPMDIFYGTLGFTLKSAGFRKGLVILQFILTIILIIGTGTIFLQLHYIRIKELGYDPENLLYLSMNSSIRSNYETVKEELKKHPGISSVSVSSELPGEIWSIMRGIVWEGKETDEGAAFGYLSVDEDYFETVRTDLLEGRDFSNDFPGDSISVILNETAINLMGMESPVGGKFDIGDEVPLNIIGVVKDFNSLPLNYKIEPVMILKNTDYFGRLLVRMNPELIDEVLPFIENTWNKFAPETPFDYQFLDDRFDALYRNELRASKIFGGFVLLGIFISCLGLLGLASFITEQRTKEIGIRKVCGATIAEIVYMLSKEISQWIFIAILVASPMAWFVMRRWLQNFEYKTNIPWWLFAFSGILALIIALATVSYQSFVVGNRNPVDSLRYE